MKHINRFSKFVPPPPAPPPPPPAPGAPPPPPMLSGGGDSGGSRGNLLQSIQSSGGLGSLRKVDESEKQKTPASGGGEVDMAGLLSAAMSNRRAGVQDSDEDAWSDDGGDWD